MTLRLSGGEEEKGTGRGDGRNKRQCGMMMKHKYTDWRDEHRHYVWFAKPHIAEQQAGIPCYWLVLLLLLLLYTAKCP